MFTPNERIYKQYIVAKSKENKKLLEQLEKEELNIALSDIEDEIKKNEILIEIAAANIDTLRDKITYKDVLKYTNGDMYEVSRLYREVSNYFVEKKAQHLRITPYDRLEVEAIIKYDKPLKYLNQEQVNKVDHILKEKVHDPDYERRLHKTIERLNNYADELFDKQFIDLTPKETLLLTLHRREDINKKKKAWNEAD